MFREQFPQVTHSSDIVHKTALCLKTVLEHDDRWSKFLQHCGQSRKHGAKSALAFLSPPTARDQARYMNLQAVLKWASDMRQFLNDPAFGQGVSVEPWRITIEFKWLEEFADSVA